MLIRSILTIAVLSSFVFGAAANADIPRIPPVVADASPSGDIAPRGFTATDDIVNILMPQRR